MPRQIGFFDLLRVAALNQQHSRIAAVGIRDGNGQGIAGSHCRLPFGQGLQILRPDIAPIDDYLVYFTAGDDDILFDTVGQITCIQPAVSR